ncbi:hypothetical protein ACEPAF_408 [Sanghuangporus sanghuang]|uniref:Uncharacterized protein n=1 Tax=Sanghuangporus baumii TaxID=108892 RepID=A0A9Q5HXB5_SANBA|nr:hypothetical protein A7U60_g5260 [Sanghuangporus baumii]
MTETEWNELLGEEDSGKDVDRPDQELCSHQVEDPGVSEMHTLWGCYRTLTKENQHLKAENASLRAELREVQMRLGDMSAAVVGSSDARARISRRVTLEEGRNDLVKLLTLGKYSDWHSYLASFPDGEGPGAAGRTLESLARAMCPELEIRAQIPPPVQSDSVWKTLTKYRSKEERKAKEVSEAEYAKRLQEAQAAQEATALLQDQELWQFVLQS